MTNHDILSLGEYDNHEQIVTISDTTTNLRGFIVIHNTNQGPAVGGTRMFPYLSEKDALKDALKLSRAMTYKCAIAGVTYGGGKGVIIGDPKKDKTKELLSAYAKKIKALEGIFYTGEDVGISEDNVQYMLTIAPFFIGKKGAAGDPSPHAAESTYYTMKTAAKKIFGSNLLKQKKIAIKGLGKVGMALLELLLQEDASLVVADINPAVIKSIEKNYPQVQICDPTEIHKQFVDIYAPVAMGNEFTRGTMKDIHARLICGAANNQLASLEIGDWLYEHGITYVPDYLANAGGLIDVVDELEPGGFNKERVATRIKNLCAVLDTVFQLAEKKHVGLHRIADELAEKIFKKDEMKKNTTFLQL